MTTSSSSRGFGELRPSGPYPLLALAGEQGSAKTVTCMLLEALIKVCPPGSRMGSASLQAVAASRCGQLYTDDAEVLFEAARPMLFNGIEDVIGRPDLADCAIVLTCHRSAMASRD